MLPRQCIGKNAYLAYGCRGVTVAWQQIACKVAGAEAEVLILKCKHKVERGNCELGKALNPQSLPLVARPHLLSPKQQL